MLIVHPPALVAGLLAGHYAAQTEGRGGGRPGPHPASPAATAELGVTVADLRAAEAAAAEIPTVAAYLPRVEAAAGLGARRTYGSYWNQMAQAWGERRLDQIRATDIETLKHEAATQAVPRRNGRGGRHAGEHVIAAGRAVFARAFADGFIAAGASPAHQIAKSRRLPSPRPALTADELAQINAAAGPAAGQCRAMPVLAGQRRPGRRMHAAHRPLNSALLHGDVEPRRLMRAAFRTGEGRC